jgi:hypothetical protein
MHTEVHDQKIFVHRSKLSWIPVVLSAASLFFLAVGTWSIFYFNSNSVAQQSFDVREQAATQNGPVTVSSELASGSTYQNGQRTTINLKVNTQGVQVYGMQLLFNVVAKAGGVTIDVPKSSNLQAIHQEVEKTADGYLVSLVVIPQTVGQPFSATSPTTFAILNLTLDQPGTVQLSFDPDKSKTVLYGVNPPQDQLRIISSASFTIANGSSSTGKQCNASCSSTSECAVNLRCYNGQCRRATYVTSATCDNPPDQGLQRKCNEYCADTRECASGYTCFFNRCRAPENPDNVSCSGVASATSTAVSASCNKSCSTSKDCAVNLRCYNNQCRLATNPSSLTCSPYTKPIVSSTYDYDLKGAKGEEIPIPTSTISAKPTASPKVSPSPIPSATESATFSPFPSPVIIQKSSPLPVAEAAQGFSLENIKNLFKNISWPLVAIGSGVILFILALIMFVTHRGDESKGSKVPPTSSGTLSPYEQELQSKINSLRQQQAGQTPEPKQTVVSVAPPAPKASTVPVSMPVKPSMPSGAPASIPTASSVARPVAQPTPVTSRPVAQTPSAPQATNKLPPKPVTPPAIPVAASIVQKAAAMPSATKPAPLPAVKPISAVPAVPNKAAKPAVIPAVPKPEVIKSKKNDKASAPVKSAPRPISPPAVASPQSSSASPSQGLQGTSTMMEKLKQKGILGKMKDSPEDLLPQDNKK